MVESPTVKFPSKESLSEFHDDINLALTKLQQANRGVPIASVCASAFQVWLNFAYAWMGGSGSQARFVEFITLQATDYVRLKDEAKAEGVQV